MTARLRGWKQGVDEDTHVKLHSGWKVICLWCITGQESGFVHSVRLASAAELISDFPGRSEYLFLESNGISKSLPGLMPEWTDRTNTSSTTATKAFVQWADKSRLIWVQVVLFMWLPLYREKTGSFNKNLQFKFNRLSVLLVLPEAERNVFRFSTIWTNQKLKQKRWGFG